MRSLKRVQALVKVLEIITKIIFVCCVIGLVFCVFGGIGVAIIGNDSNAWAEISKSAQTTMSFNMGMCTCIVGAIMCAGETALYYYVKKFYKKELLIGTPFDKTVVREMRKIGILHIAIPFGVAVISAIVMLIFRVDLNITSIGDLTIGLVYILLSLVFDYGADLRQIEIETVKIREEVLRESAIEPKVENDIAKEDSARTSEVKETKDKSTKEDSPKVVRTRKKKTAESVEKPKTKKKSNKEE